MTQKDYDIFVRTLPEDGQNAFRYNGTRYFLNNEPDGWHIERVTEFEKGDVSPKDEFETLKVYPSVGEMVSDIIIEGKSMNEIYPEMELADF